MSREVSRLLSRVLRFGLGVTFALALFLGLFEIALRLAPEVIPLQLLRHYPSDLRLKIAADRGLPSRNEMIEIRPRDGGPPFLVYRPGATIEFGSRMGGEGGEVAMNDQGFCNPPSVSYSADSVDVVALGDSFTWCTQVAPDQTWAYQLSRFDDIGTVYNLGRSGVGLYEHLAIFRRFGAQLQPEQVVMLFYEGNDYRDALRRSRYLAGLSPQPPVDV